MGVQEVTNAPDFARITTTSGNRLVVVDFMAKWCGPCHAIAPRVAQFSEQYPNVTFIKVDTDQLAEVARACNIRAMPTFQFYKGGKKVAEFTGANPARLEELIKQHQTTDGDAGAAPAGESTVTVAGTMVDLTDVVEKNQLNCLNEVRSHPVANILTANDTYLESDTDEQLLIEVRFNQAVKLHSLKIKTNDASFAPKHIRLFANRPNLGFDGAMSAPSTQDLELTRADVNGETVIPLRFVKFQSVNSLSIFVKSNQGGEDVTRINRLVLLGLKVDTTDMNNFKKTASADE